jgi:hypothetical protein
MIRPLRPLVAAAVLTVVVTSVTPASARATDADADAVRVWNGITVTTLVNATIPAPVAPLYLSYVHQAVNEAVMGAGPRRSVPAAVATAAHTVLTHHFPDQQARLDRALRNALADIPGGSAKGRGIRVGTAAAESIIAARAGDGLNGPDLPVPPAGPGEWQPVPPLEVATASWLGSVTPFVLDSPSQFRPAGPPSLASDRWVRDYREVKALGSLTSTSRTAEQTEVALFWSDSPTVQSQRALRGLSRQNHLDAKATARLLAVANTAAADGLIACFDAKFHFNFWRPILAIPAGGTDGNPRTAPDPTWTPLLPLTPNYPEYPSAHGCATPAIAQVVDALDGRRGFSFVVSSDVTGTTHRFTSVAQLTREVGNARIWGGLHWRFGVDAGTAIARAVAREVLRAAG